MVRHKDFDRSDVVLHARHTEEKDMVVFRWRWMSSGSASAKISRRTSGGSENIAGRALLALALREAGIFLPFSYA